MKRLFLLLVAMIVASVGLQAQQIAVVSKSGTTSIYKSLPEAVAGASAGSTVYLPGGGFTLTDTLKINKKLTLVGVGYNIASGNAEGATLIDGIISFIGNSSGSVLMGCKVSKDIYIGIDGSAVEDVVLKYCWLSNIIVSNSLCMGLFVNQNYCGSINLGETNGKVTNNVTYNPYNGISAEIAYNIITGSYVFGGGMYGYDFKVKNSTISNNVIFTNPNLSYHTLSYESSNFGISNMGVYKIGESYIMVDDDWKNVFVNYNDGRNTPVSDFHFSEAYQQYEGKVGIYAGSGFNDSGMPPVPYISYKYIPDHTDADGNLNIKIRVKASE